MVMNQPISVCIQANSLHVILPESTEWFRLSVVAMANTIMAFSTVPLNALVIFTILSTRALATPSFLLLACLSATDLLIGLGGQPSQVAISLFYRDGQTEWYCFTRVAATVVFVIGGSASIMVVTAIAIDRYLAIRIKTRYRVVVTVARVKVVVLIIWAFALFIAVLPFFTSPEAASIFGALYVLLCLVITITCYILLFFLLKKHCVQIATQGPAQKPDRLTQTINIAKYKRILKTMLIVLAFIIFCYSFMVGVLLVITNTDKSKGTRWGLLTIVGLNSTFNPVIYICRMRELRRACLKVIRKLCCACKKWQ